MPFLPKVLRQESAPTQIEEQPLTPPVARAVAAMMKKAAPDADQTVARIEVHDAISNMAWAYEKLRQAIDYQDEHLLRKNAIERIVKRRLVSGVTAEAVAEPLLLELIRGRYLPNNKVPSTAIQDVANIVNSYIHLWAQVPTSLDDRETDRLFNWYLALMAVEINEKIAPAGHDEELVHLLLAIVARDITFAEGEMAEEAKATQCYIAAHRTLLKSDLNIVRYHLFLRRHPEWRHPTEDVIGQIGPHLPAIRQAIEADIRHPAGDVLQRVMKKYAILFSVFDDIVQKHGSAAAEELTHPEVLEADTREAFEKRRKLVTAKITRSIIRSTVYIFLTKMVLLLVIELPIDKLLAGGESFARWPLIVNATFPPLLLLLVGISAGAPGKKNEDAVVAKVKQLVYHGDERNALVKPRKPIRRSAFFIYLYRFFYAIIFLAVFGGIIFGLTSLHFTPVSTFIFILFLTIVSFFGIRIRLLAKELEVVDQSENLLTILFDFLSVPILQVGRWLSLRVPRINVVILFLDFIIEAPFKAFLEATEGFLGFIREKREEIY